MDVFDFSMMDLSGGGKYEMNLRVLLLCYVGSIAILLVWYVHVLFWKTAGNCDNSSNIQSADDRQVRLPVFKNTISARWVAFSSSSKQFSLLQRACQIHEFDA